MSAVESSILHVVESDGDHSMLDKVLGKAILDWLFAIDARGDSGLTGLLGTSPFAQVDLLRPLAFASPSPRLRGEPCAESNKLPDLSMRLRKW